MDRCEYFRMKLELFPQDIIDEYGLQNKVDADGNVFCEVQWGMYSLPQAGQLHQAGYRQSTVTPGYWRQEWRLIGFTLVVDDFGVKFINKTDVDHLISVLSQDYNIDTDWNGTWYLGLGLTLGWDYKIREVHLSMPGYIKKSPRQIWPHTTRQATATTTPTNSHSLRCNHPVCQTHRPIIQSHLRATKIHSTSHWSITLLWTSSLFNNPGCPELFGISTSSPNRIHYGTHQMAPWLRRNQSRSHPHIRK